MNGVYFIYVRFDVADEFEHCPTFNFASPVECQWSWSWKRLGHKLFLTYCWGEP